MMKCKDFTTAFKLVAIQRAIAVGNCAASKEHDADECCTHQWKAEKDDLRKRQNKQMPLLGLL